MCKFFFIFLAALLAACSMISCASAQEIIFQNGFDEPVPSPPLPGSIHVELQPGAPTMISPPANGATQVVLFDGVLKNSNTSQFEWGLVRFDIVPLDPVGTSEVSNLQLKIVSFGGGGTIIQPTNFCPGMTCVIFQMPGIAGLSGITEQHFQLLGTAFPAAAGRRYVVRVSSPSSIGGFFIPSAALQLTGVPRSGPVIAPQ